MNRTAFSRIAPLHLSQGRGSAAFSLVELSIVLVILGLLVGGILAGQSLIRASELRSVTEDYTRYITAVHAYRDKYFALPGDHATATSFWGASNADPATCVTIDASGGTATCNGDGNGLVGVYDSSQFPWHESFLFYKHLANAGLIPGQYAGIYYPSGQRMRIGGNIPASKIPNAFFLLVASTWSGNGNIFDGRGNWFYYGKRAGWAGGPVEPVITPPEAWNLDTKFDDGTPGTGRMMANKACSTTTLPSTALYNLASTTTDCYIYFPTGL